MTAITMSAPALSERPMFKVTRMGIFAVFFLLAAVMLFSSMGGLTPATLTTLTFGADLPVIVVGTFNFTLVVGALYVIVGVVGLLPVPTLKRAQSIGVGIALILLVPALLIVAAANNSINVTVMLQVSLRLSTPIVMGALAGIWCERSGVTNIAIEGMMLSGACFGFTAFTLFLAIMPTSEAQLLGVIFATLTGGAMALLHGWLSITFKTNQVVSGTVINILAIGVTSFIRRDVLLSSEAARETLQPLAIPVLSQIPIVGDIFFNGRPIFYAMFVILFATHIILFYTRWGLRTRAVGENPKAADTLGINVNRNRWTNVFIGGLIAGLAGAWFSMETSGSFDDNMTSGRGFIALAAMIFGKWMPFGAFGGGLLFGFSDALGQRFQFLGVPIPPQFLQMVPYFITIVVLAGLVGRAVGPKAAGEPYDKEGK
ncbi:MAG: ABC transporter permease [Chloroflexota bacterium]|nr:ABC transporter permease [Chloroflexota bacterium]